MSAYPSISSATESDRQLAAASHWGAMAAALLTSWSAGFAGMLVGGVIYLLFKDRALIRSHAAETFNFHFGFFVWVVAACIVVGILSILTLGLGLILFVPLWVVAAIIWLVCGIQGTRAALRGAHYHYPFSIRLLS